MKSYLLRGSVVTASLLLSQSAGAAPKRVGPAKGDPTACLKASETAQSLENAGKLLEASTAYAECAQTKCPDVVAADCSTALDRLKGRIPTISLRVHDVKNQDILSARVYVDGQPQLDALKGTPLLVNPGTHTLKVEADGYTEVTRSVLLTTGEQARVIAVVLTKPGEGIPSDAGSAASGAGIAPWVVVGVGAAGVAVGGLLYATAPAFPSECTRGDANSCPPGPYAEAATSNSKAEALGLAVAAGGAAVAVGGLVWYFVTPKEDARPALRLEPAVGGFTGLRAVGHF